MSSHLGLIEAVMLEVFVVLIGVRELHLLRKDEKKKEAAKRDGESGKSV